MRVILFVLVIAYAVKVTASDFPIIENFEPVDGVDSATYTIDWKTDSGYLEG